jgi:hypothetical protein
MAFYHERAQPYPRETVFEQDVLVAIKPRDIERWMCKKVYGMTDLGLDGHPIHGRSSSLEFYKKALSYFMPNKRMGWNKVTQAGNPTKSSNWHRVALCDDHHACTHTQGGLGSS